MASASTTDTARPGGGAAIADTHCHLDYVSVWEGKPEISRKPEDVVNRAMEAGVRWMVNPAVEPANFDDVMAMAETFDSVYAAIAVHPTDVAPLRDISDWKDDILKRLDHPKVVAVGETGLDYYRTEAEDEREWQRECFRWFLSVARDRDMPVIIHDREAHDDIHRLVDECKGVRGIMHCFSGDADFARAMVDLGFYISFAGNVTFKSAQALRDAAKVTPLEGILTETDSPFLCPVPYRGQVNEPARVSHVVETIAQVKGLTYDEVAAATLANAERVFGIGAASAT